ncbi:MAG: LPS export ABC transporter periplasmic protein LptC [Treponema sp.]|nr:LPS export ABC transporter periplasmic protein LptC [Treponema sp.]
MKKNIHFTYGIICVLSILITISCTFDYGDGGSSDEILPEIVMINVEYVRVRSADPIARIQAERAERYDKLGIMKLEHLSFEQYGEKGEEVYLFGTAGNASFVIDSGDITLDNGVRIEVESEDIVIETKELDWKDEPRILSSGPNEEVFISQENGSIITGIGLRVDTRKRTWDFFGTVSGIYVHEDDDDAEDANESTAER